MNRRLNQVLSRGGWAAACLILVLLGVALWSAQPAAPARAQPGTSTATPTDTSTPTVVPNTATPTDTSTPTVVPNTATPTDTSTPTVVPNTATPTDTSTPTVVSTATATATATATLVPSSCSPGSAVNQRTLIIGKGTGSDTARIVTAKLVVPNAADVISLYGQYAGKEQGVYRYPRFLRPNGTYINDQSKESPAYKRFAVFWYGTQLTPPNLPHWRARLIGAKTSKPFVQRAFVLYPTYQTSGQYVDVFQTFPVSAANHVSWEPGWIPAQQQIVALPPPLMPVDLVVSVAVVDNDRDSRVFELTVTAGSVSESVSYNNPTHGNLLNIVTVTLEDVPAGTSEIVIDLVSPHLTGDSVAMTGMTAYYGCSIQ